MQIEVQSSEAFLEEFRLFLEDELEKNGYFKGPKVGHVESGVMETYIKGDVIVSLQVKDSDSGVSVLHIEGEQELPDMKDMWDRAVVKYGNNLLQRLREIAQNPAFVEKELKK